MTQESPAEQLRRLGGVGSQAQRPGPGNSGAGRGQPPRPPGGRGGGPDRPGGGRPPQGSGQPDPDLQWFRQQYLKDGYFDQNNNLRPELVVDDAIKVARILGGRYGRRELSTAQLRRFFGKARLIEQKLNSQQSFDGLVAEIHEMQPLAANAVSKDVGPPEVFKDFIDRNVDYASRSEKDFKEGFIKHIQSVVAYFAYLKSRQPRRR